jgi:hypothetical protein
MRRGGRVGIRKEDRFVPGTNPAEIFERKVVLSGVAPVSRPSAFVI